MNYGVKMIQNDIDVFKEENPNESVGDLSDGYHTFNELYNHRAVLTALAFIHLPYAWKSKVHEDGSMFDGMFIVGAPTPYGMITYHYELEYWNLFKIPELPHAPHFDGHTPNDVVDRIKKYIMSATNKLVNNSNVDDIEEIVERDILPVFGDNMIGTAAYIGFYNK